MSREFFATRTVAEALDGFNPALRTPAQTVPLAQALGRVPARDVLAPAPLPGFARSTVDGYAVRAADTYGASEGLPCYLDVIGAVQMGVAPRVRLAAGTAVEMPTGGVLPAGADAVAMVEYTSVTMPGTVEVLRPVPPGGGIVRADDDAAAGAVLVPAGRPLRAADLVVISAGSSVGARDSTAQAVAALGKPGIFCHGLAIKPGKPTLLAECDGVPVIGLPGNPLSALVAFRLLGVPLVWRLAGCATPPPEPSVIASLTRDVPSQAGRRDVVQVQLSGGQATPLFGASALLSVLTRADGYFVVPESATGLDVGASVSVVLYR